MMMMMMIKMMIGDGGDNFYGNSINQSINQWTLF